MGDGFRFLAIDFPYLQEEEAKDEEDCEGVSPSGFTLLERGRASLQLPTDEDKVPLMTHVVPPELVKELLYELKTDWAICATSEVGVAARGALAIGVPVVLFTHNAKHQEILKEGLETGIMQSCCVDGGDFSNANLVHLAKAAEKVGNVSESSSEGQSSEHTSGSSNQDKKEKKSKKSKKEKKSSTKKSKKEKAKGPKKKAKGQRKPGAKAAFAEFLSGSGA